jgi:hypothetical protein
LSFLAYAGTLSASSRAGGIKMLFITMRSETYSPFAAAPINGSRGRKKCPLVARAQTRTQNGPRCPGRSRVCAAARENCARMINQGTSNNVRGHQLARLRATGQSVKTRSSSVGPRSLCRHNQSTRVVLTMQLIKGRVPLI